MTTVELTRTRLDARVRRIFVGFGFSALGSGLTMPFLFVYLSEVRGISTVTVGLVFAYMGALGFVAAPIGGSVIDRFGPRPVMLVGLVTECLSTAAIGRVATVPQALLVATVMTLGSVGLWPASTAMLTRLVPVEERERVYGLQFMLLNAGLGVGGLVSAAIVDIGSVASFQRLYLIDAASYVVYLVVLASLPRGTGLASPPPIAGDAPVGPAAVQPGWGTVLRDRTLLRVVGLSILAVTFGYSQFETGFAAYTVDVAGVAPRFLGLAYGANTATIVIGQLLTLRLVKGRRRSAMLATCAAIWAVSWAVIASSDATSGAVSVVLVVIGLGVFGVGETIWAPMAPAIVNDLAPEEMRGRYNALQGMTWTVASIVGPAFAGLMIGGGLAHEWIATLVVGMMVAAVLFARLRHHVTDRQDGLAVPDGAGVTD
ncbi:MFS transporter [Nocardioides terrisoli]|uniref:MFS transporter n=1 Tax=Nocardioides terrisoli TaxID=3388267 RepID=UPI00287B7F04|nr:MFS transporter [Nocardioides marmorisolisilvae]